MGSACCVAARDRTPPNRISGDALQTNAIYSPSWSFRWDNQRRLACEIENPSCQFSHGTSRGCSVEMEGEFGFDMGNSFGGGSSLENFGTPISQESPVHEEVSANPAAPPSDLFMASNGNKEVKSSTESPEIADLSAPKLSFSVPSISSFSAPTADPWSSQTLSLPGNSMQSKWAHCLPKHQLLRQVSDSRILGMKSPNGNFVSDGRASCSNDLTAGSQGGSCDGWSMRTFSELVASSQRERWSFDSEWLGSSRGKLNGSSSRLSYSPSIDLQTCGACSKPLTERSSWSSQKIIASNELSVVAVLVCGHVFHAECLETMTPESDCYDPCCPICTVGENQISKMSRKALRAEAEFKSRISKISRNRVMDSYLDSEFDVRDRQKNTKQEGKGPKMESCSSVRSSFTKPFLRRHFSLGSKWSRSILENDSSRKKGFWARYRKD